MTTQEALKELQNYQHWRMGAEIKQPNPKIITEAINIAIEIMKKAK